MSGFLLVADYSSSSDEDVNESSAKCIKLGDSGIKRFKKLPLPSIFTQKQETDIHNDDPEQHGGRIRSFPHQRGNWSTFVYVSCSPNEQFQNLIHILYQECSRITTFHCIEDFHISLSRTVVLKFHWITNFISALRKNLQQFEKFVVIFDSLDVYCNDDKTRTFLSLKVGHTGSSDLEKIVTNVDRSLKEFDLQSFYEDPSFHISLLWCVGDKRTELEAILPSLEVILSEISDNVPSEEDSFCNQLIDRVMCKSGNKIFNFALK